MRDTKTSGSYVFVLNSSVKKENNNIIENTLNSLDIPVRIVGWWFLISLCQKQKWIIVDFYFQIWEKCIVFFNLLNLKSSNYRSLTTMTTLNKLINEILRKCSVKYETSKYIANIFTNLQIIFHLSRYLVKVLLKEFRFLKPK